MPTPFIHLYLAEKLLQSVETAGDSTKPTALLTAQLHDSWPAFCLGNVAPDYQVLCDIAREATHFYSLPPLPSADAGDTMLALYPQLQAANCRSQDQAVFIAGYISHLLVDLIWFREILLPYFIDADGLGEIHERFYWHNLTLIVLDQRSSQRLPAGLDRILMSATSDRWLPFADDDDLERWRNYLAEQLTDGGETLTAQIYAERMSIPVATLHANLNDVKWLQRNLLARVPLDMIESKLDATVAQSLFAVQDYLSGFTSR